MVATGPQLVSCHNQLEYIFFPKHSSSPLRLSYRHSLTAVFFKENLCFSFSYEWKFVTKNSGQPDTPKFSIKVEQFPYGEARHACRGRWLCTLHLPPKQNVYKKKKIVWHKTKYVRNHKQKELILSKKERFVTLSICIHVRPALAHDCLWLPRPPSAPDHSSPIPITLNQTATITCSRCIRGRTREWVHWAGPQCDVTTPWLADRSHG